MTNNPLSVAFAADTNAPTPSRPSQLQRQRHQRYLQVEESSETRLAVDGSTATDEDCQSRRCCCSRKLRQKLSTLLSRMLLIFLVLLVVYVIYAAIVTSLYADYYELGYTDDDYFGGFWTSLYTLFGMMVNGMSSDIVLMVSAHDYSARITFVSFFVIASFIAIPMTIVVIDDSVRNIFPPLQQKSDMEVWLEYRLDEIADAAEGKAQTSSAPREAKFKRREATCSYRKLQLRKMVVVVSRLLAIGFVLLILYLIYSTLLTWWFKDLYVRGLTSEDYFGRFDATMFTLFAMMVDGGVWGDVQSEVMYVYSWAWAPFLSFFVLSTFISIPVTIAVLGDAVRNLFPPVQEPTETDLLLDSKVEKLNQTVMRLLESQKKMQQEIQKLVASPAQGAINVDMEADLPGTAALGSVPFPGGIRVTETVEEQEAIENEITEEPKWLEKEKKEEEQATKQEETSVFEDSFVNHQEEDGKPC